MCLLLCAFKSHPDYPLIIAANRDEFHSRPASEAHYWDDDPAVLAGRDLQAGGTWLGITKSGRIAAVTNYHETTLQPLPTKSRGALVSKFLSSDEPPKEYADHLINEGNDYQGFTLVFGTVDELFCFSNRSNTCEEVSPGIHGLSNHLFNDGSWKVGRGTSLLENLLSGPDAVSPGNLLALLRDRTRAPDPAVQVHDYEKEEGGQYSSIFIKGREFGTRCSTAVMVDGNGRVLFSERTFSPEGAVANSVEYEFVLGNDK